MPVPARRVLAFVDGSRGSDEVVAAAQELATPSDARVTLVAVAVIEDERPGCCDLRSGVWNRMQRELAAEQLRTAEARIGSGVRPRRAIVEGTSVEQSLVDESRSGGYDLIVVANERRSRWPWRSCLADRLRARVDCEVVTPEDRRRQGAPEPVSLSPSGGSD